MNEAHCLGLLFVGVVCWTVVSALCSAPYPCGHVFTFHVFPTFFHFFDPAAVLFCELFNTSMGGTTNLSEGQVELCWSNQSCLSWGCLSRSAAVLYVFAPEGGHELLTHPHVGPSCSLSNNYTTEIVRNVSREAHFEVPLFQSEIIVHMW